MSFSLVESNATCDPSVPRSVQSGRVLGPLRRHSCRPLRGRNGTRCHAPASAARADHPEPYMLSVPSLELFTRIGFAARGLMYVLIGYFALRWGQAEEGTQAIAHLAQGSGKLLLGLMAIGFAAYGVWRVAEALIDSEGHG